MAIQTQMNLGRVRPVYKGAYNALAAYGTLDMVLYEKEIWMMVARSYTPGDLPVDAGNGLSASGAWAKIGYQGERGLQGETGPIGPYYRPSVAVDGTFSWTNDGGLVNPDPVKIDLYWHQISGTCTQVSTTQFTVAGTEAAIVEGRGVRINDSLLAHISAVAVENDVTTVTVDSAVVPATILKVEVGVISTDMLPTITGFLPLSGGTLTGVLNTKDIFIDDAAIRSKLDTQFTNVYGGIGWRHGAYLSVSGKDEPNTPGCFYLFADNGVTNKALEGRPDGTLTWDNKDVATILTGTWTPELANFSFTTRTATYIKIGKIVFINGHIVGSFPSLPAQQAYLTGIPFDAGEIEQDSVICHATGGVNGSAKRIIHGSTYYNNLRLYAISSRNTTADDGCGQIGYAYFSQSSTDAYNIYFNSSNKNLDLWFSGSYIATA